MLIHVDIPAKIFFFLFKDRLIDVYIKHSAHIYMYIYIYMSVCIHIHVYTCNILYIYIQYVYICIYIYIYMGRMVFLVQCQKRSVNGKEMVQEIQTADPPFQTSENLRNRNLRDRNLRNGNRRQSFSLIVLFLVGIDSILQEAQFQSSGDCSGALSALHRWIIVPIKCKLFNQDKFLFIRIFFKNVSLIRNLIDSFRGGYS